MATLSYPRHSLARRIHKNKLAAELPHRMLDVQQIHQVNYTVLFSSVLIALAIFALAWLITANAMRARMPNPTSDIAVSTYSMPALSLPSTSATAGLAQIRTASH